jgi:hypothetical protein
MLVSSDRSLWDFHCRVRGLRFHWLPRHSPAWCVRAGFNAGAGLWICSKLSSILVAKSNLIYLWIVQVELSFVVDSPDQRIELFQFPVVFSWWFHFHARKVCGEMSERL